MTLLTAISTEDGAPIWGLQGHYSDEQAIKIAKRQAAQSKDRIAIRQLRESTVKVEQTYA